MKKNWFLIFFSSILLSINVNAQENFSAKAISVGSDENQSLYGDSVRIVFNRAVTKKNWVDPRITSSQAVPSAPAGYTNNTSARNAARNYTIEIIPAPNTRTQAYTGTWYDLGGIVTYDEATPTLDAVVLSLGRDIFKPGDKVVITLSDKLVDTQGHKITPQTLTFSTFAS